MTSIRFALLGIFIGAVVGGCQTSESRKEQLAAICADPANRAPKSSYFSECQTLYPSSNQTLARNYRLGAPLGN